MHEKQKPFTLYNKPSDPLANVSKGIQRTASTDILERPAGKPMTPYYNQILAEVTNQNTHQQNQIDKVNSDNNGRREFLMNKKKKTDVSYSNINRKELENETVSYFKEIDHRRKHSVERVDRAELQSQHSVSNLSQRSVSPYCGRGRVNLKNQESNELPKHSHRSMVANRLMHQDSNPLNRGESADNLQMQPKRTASNSSTNKLRSKYSNPILQNDLNDNNLNNVSEIEAYNRKMSNSSVNKFKQQQNINQNSQQVSKLQLGSLTRNSSHASQAQSIQPTSVVNRSEYNSNQSQKSNKEKKNIFKSSNVTRNIREYNADLRKPQDTGRSRADAQKDITSTEFNNIEDAYNVQKMAMQTQFVKDSKHKENSLEKIWGGLHSIDKDRNVEQRMQVLKAYHEFNHQKAQEQAKNEDRQKHALLENAKKESTLLQEYRASIADDHKRQNVLCKSRGNIQANQIKDQKRSDVVNHERLQEREEMNRIMRDNSEQLKKMREQEMTTKKAYKQLLNEQSKSDNKRKFMLDMQDRGLI